MAMPVRDWMDYNWILLTIYIRYQLSDKLRSRALIGVLAPVGDIVP
jgi:hypothetical protein